MDMKGEAVEILIVGLGGLGVMSLAASIAELLRYRYPKVITNETRAIAQRRASVSAAVRAGNNLYASTLHSGTADIVIGLEPMEVLRFENYLQQGTFCLLSDAIIPINKASNHHLPSCDTIHNRLSNIGTYNLWLPVSEYLQSLNLEKKYTSSILLGAFARSIDIPFECLSKVTNFSSDNRSLLAMELGYKLPEIPKEQHDLDEVAFQPDLDETIRIPA